MCVAMKLGLKEASGVSYQPATKPTGSPMPPASGRSIVVMIIIQYDDGDKNDD